MTGVHLNGATIMTTPTDRHLRIARETGYEGVEVRAERLLAAPEELAASADIVRPREVWSLNGIQLQLTPDGGLDHGRLAAEMAPRLDICRRLAAAYLLVVPPRAADADREHAIGAMRDGLAILRDAAARDGIGVAFEFLGFGDCPIDTPELAGRVVADLPGVDLVLDSCHWHASGAGSLDAFPIDRLAMVHLNDAPAKAPREIEDADRLLPGRGVIRLAELVGTLRAAGYRGPWSLETFNPDYWAAPPEQIATEGRAAVARVLDAPADRA
ncbi:MAG: sugar phosphate isomerase/epimerase family protein [Candidatus Limnocylindrales bacterium]|nr:sugar phosphate isomerase/epimerase family protein [Candidatus Limnocylindrales bacterium]